MSSTRARTASSGTRAIAAGLLALIGVGIALDSWLSILAAAGIPLLAILIRIAVEEARLARDLGDDYRRYALHTKRLIPGLW